MNLLSYECPIRPGRVGGGGFNDDDDDTAWFPAARLRPLLPPCCQVISFFVPRIVETSHCNQDRWLSQMTVLVPPHFSQMIHFYPVDSNRKESDNGTRKYTKESMPAVIYRRERDLLQFISQFMQKNGFAPTLAEICDGLGLRSPATVHEHIQNLIDKGVLKKDEGVRRGLEIVDQRVLGWIQTAVEVPLIGRIAAGSPIEAIEDHTAAVTVPPDMVGKKRCFALQVRGTSMIEAAILDGDFVICEETSEANNGDIVVALLNESFATLKRFFKEIDHIRLEPANSAMNPIITKNARIQGKVVGVIRKFN